MSLIRLENITKFFGPVCLFDAINFRIEKGEKVGLIGRNGAGKSTFFRILTGKITPDSGIVEYMRNIRIAELEQLPDIRPGETIYDIALRPFIPLIEQKKELSELEQKMEKGDVSCLEKYSLLQEKFRMAGGYDYEYRINRILQGLGFNKKEFSLSVSNLSGGQRTRLMLALVLLENADVLLLDEPENHLDLAAREWLENFLKETSKAFIIISHDRHILNAVTNRIIEIESGKLLGFRGNYDSYVANRKLVRDQQEKTVIKQQRQLAKDEAFINKFRYKATKAKQVQSRIKRLEKLKPVVLEKENTRIPRFSLECDKRSGERVIDASDLTVAFGEDVVLYRNFSLTVYRGERIGIIGPNGEGKTTLLRHLMGELEPGNGISGKVVWGQNVLPAFYRQHHEDLCRKNDIFSELQSIRPELTPEQLRSFLGNFLFSGDAVYKTIANLSGGELSRVAIAKLILSKANVLFLDEPTNHLDTNTQEILEQALLDFGGTILLVSHDRTLIDKIVQKLIIVQGGNITVYWGNYSDYLNKQGSTASKAIDERDVLKIRKQSVVSSPSKKHLRTRDEKRLRERERRKMQKELEQIEENIENLEQLLQEIEHRFTTIDITDYQRMKILKDEYDALKNDLQSLYKAWEETAEKLDTLKQE